MSGRVDDLDRRWTISSSWGAILARWRRIHYGVAVAFLSVDGVAVSVDDGYVGAIAVDLRDAAEALHIVDPGAAEKRTVELSVVLLNVTARRRVDDLAIRTGVNYHRRRLGLFLLGLFLRHLPALDSDLRHDLQLHSLVEEDLGVAEHTRGDRTPDEALDGARHGDPDRLAARAHLGDDPSELLEDADPLASSDSHRLAVALATEAGVGATDHDGNLAAGPYVQQDKRLGSDAAGGSMDIATARQGAVGAVGTSLGVAARNVVVAVVAERPRLSGESRTVVVVEVRVVEDLGSSLSGGHGVDPRWQEPLVGTRG